MFFKPLYIQRQTNEKSTKPSHIRLHVGIENRLQYLALKYRLGMFVRDNQDIFCTGFIVLLGFSMPRYIVLLGFSMPLSCLTLELNRGEPTFAFFVVYVRCFSYGPVQHALLSVFRRVCSAVR